mgnify:CR=1 FL=1
MPKHIAEDWSFFNEAVRRRAQGIMEPKREAVPPSVKEAPKPVPPSPAPVRPSAPPPSRPPAEPNGWQPYIALLAAIAFIILLLMAMPRNPALTNSGGGGTEKVVTNYTIFHSVDFRSGAVITGWNFERSGDPVPKNEYCYFNILTSFGASARFDIENRPIGGRAPYPGPKAVGLSPEEWDEAATKCHWHPSSRPASAATR